MSPYEIDVMLWYYSRPGDHEDVNRNPPVWRPTIDRFVEDGLLTTDATQVFRRPLRDGTTYYITERGEAFVEQLMAVCPPTSIWVSDQERAQIILGRAAVAQMQAAKGERDG